MVQDILHKIKAVSREDWAVAAIIILISALAFGLGRLSVLYGREGELKFEYPATAKEAVLGASSFEVSGASFENLEPSTSSLVPSGGGYVASKTGSKYHLPWCPGAQSIKEENKIYFATKEEAEARGYEPAGNCKGI